MMRDDWEGTPNWATVQQICADEVARAEHFRFHRVREILQERSVGCGDSASAYFLASMAVLVDRLVSNGEMHQAVKTLPRKVVEGCDVQNIDALFFANGKALMPMWRKKTGARRRKK